ncbi:hypothetical protein BDY19DRAFT_908891 [Irpex rosettiformis]|uniref:Uncharacterized protein n=1 Tax=Irpex rosettiformis TaxID=378272 RepID=A0ACB8TUX4_9APHY|nr:hypothetical protein BDY19DRAFT_908891 [Irpex rosettiformis]
MDTALVVSGEQTTSASAIAALAWVTWDTIVNFGDENSLPTDLLDISSRPSSWIKWSYAFIRYIPILHEWLLRVGFFIMSNGKTLSASACVGWMIEQLLATWSVILIVDIMLMARANCRDQTIWVALVAEIVAMLIAISLTIPKIKLAENCSGMNSPATLMAYWLSSLLFETFLFVLTLHRFFRYIATHHIYDGTFMFIFMRDGTWAFAMIFTVLLLNTLFYQLIHSPLIQAGYFWVLAVMSFTGSHVLLNIRRFANKQLQETLPTTQGSSAIAFTTP